MFGALRGLVNLFPVILQYPHEDLISEVLIFLAYRVLALHEFDGLLEAEVLVEVQVADNNLWRTVNPCSAVNKHSLIGVNHLVQDLARWNQLQLHVQLAHVVNLEIDKFDAKFLVQVDQMHKLLPLSSYFGLSLQIQNSSHTSLRQALYIVDRLRVLPDY